MEESLVVMPVDLVDIWLGATRRVHVSFIRRLWYYYLGFLPTDGLVFCTSGEVFGYESFAVLEEHRPGHDLASRFKEGV